MAKKVKAEEMPFEEKLVLFRYFKDLLGIDKLEFLSKDLNNEDYEGYDENQNTKFYGYFEHEIYKNSANIKIAKDKLKQYDEHICKHINQIGKKRGGIILKYFQYLAVLFTEIYLDKYFADADGFAQELTNFAQEIYKDKLPEGFNFTTKDLNKIAFMSATGSGKTLIMHINILQYLFYLKRAKRIKSNININKIIVLSPNEGMSNQHLIELGLSSIPAAIFDKNSSGIFQNKDDVVIIDMNKLKEDNGIKTVSVDSFEQNNLVLVDEAHRGLAGDVWYDYRTRLSADGGFAFEYSATLKQALKAADKNKKFDKKIIREYYKSIILDYSYFYFHNDGYGKEYRILNLRANAEEEQRQTYFVGCLLAYYQQLCYYNDFDKECKEFNIEKPLLVYVGNRVTASTSEAELTDIEEVLVFLNQFVSNKELAISRIVKVLSRNTGLVDATGYDIFDGDFRLLKAKYQREDTMGQDAYRDLLKAVFNIAWDADEYRLHIENIK